MNDETHVEINERNARDEVEDHCPGDAPKKCHSVTSWLQFVKDAPIVAVDFLDGLLHENGHRGHGTQDEDKCRHRSGAPQGNDLAGTQWMAHGDVPFCCHDDDEPGAGNDEQCDKTVGHQVQVDECVVLLVIGLERHLQKIE